MDFFQRKYSYLIIAVSIFLTLGTFLYGVKLFNDLQNLRASEVALFQEGQKLDETFGEFQRALGFGGYIHNVKEYLVHRKPSQLFILEANVEELKRSFNQLQSHFSGRESQPALEILDDFIASMENKLVLLRDTHGQGQSVLELDELMGLESPELLSALVTLESLQNRDYRHSIAQIQRNIDQMAHDLVMASVLLPIILAFGGMLVWMLNQAISAKKSLEATQKKLSENQRLLEVTGQLAKVGGWELELKTGKKKWTREMFLLHGLLPEQYENPTFDKLADLYPPESLESLQAAIRRAQEAGEPFDLELPFNHPEEGERLARIVCQPVLENSDVVRLSGAFQDLTESRALEGRLRQAEKMDSIGQLAGGVAHDFNNMLSVILGYTELAKMKINPTDPLFSDLEQVLTAANRSRDITRQLLTFARKQTLEPKVLDLNETVEGMLKMLHRLIGENIDLKWLPQSDLGPVEIDPSLLDQILANLCINARDAIEDIGKVTIETGQVQFDKDYCHDHPGFLPGNFLMLAVSDDGSGMDKETQSKIFDPFFTTKPVGHGTGLGLATVFGAVKQSNGFINVYSELGKGTTLRIYLPLCTGPTEEVMSSVTDDPIDGQGETILLVEDERQVLEFADRVLKDLGYKTLVSQSPAEALGIAAAHTGNIHLLVTDVVMPEMNGRELSNRLRSLYPKLETLYMSGYTANVIAHHGVLEKGIHFIQKPFSRHDLGRQIRKALNEKNKSEKEGLA